MSFSCETFLSTIVCYRKHCHLRGHGPPPPRNAPGIHTVECSQKHILNDIISNIVHLTKILITYYTYFMFSLQCLVVGE